MKRRLDIKELTRAEVMALVEESVSKLGVTLEEFRTWNHSRQTRTISGTHASMLLSLLKAGKTGGK